MNEDNRPVLVGTAQLVVRDADPREAPEPLEMLLQMARDAARNAGTGDQALRGIDSVGLTDVAGWLAPNGGRFLAEQLGATSRCELASGLGGEAPLTMVNRLARRIANGESRIALAVGCNNMHTLKRARQREVKLDWKIGGSGQAEVIAEPSLGNNPLEQQHGLDMPVQNYPVLENALRARLGLSLEKHRERLGRLFAPFTETAAKNPYAWFPVRRSAAELVTPTAENRMIAFPYTKYLNAVLETDQAAGVLLMSAGAARELGIAEDRWLYWWGGAYTKERAWFVSERPDLSQAPAMAECARRTLASANVTIDEIDRIDFYSCFPVAVQSAAESYGVADGDPRALTVTGGLPYAGGPANNYTLHSLAAMADLLRSHPGEKGLVTGNGWYLTKHSGCVWSTERPTSDGIDPGPNAADPLPAPLPVVVASRGTGRIESYTVVYDREGAPARGIVIGRTDEDQRFIANTPADRALLERFVASEQVGRKGRLSRDGELGRFEPE